MSDKIDVGESVRITNGDGFQEKPGLALFDPSDVVLTLRAPDGTVTDLSASVQSDDTGLYYADYTVDQEGRYRFKWDGDSIIEQGEFWVVPDEVGEEGS